MSKKITIALVTILALANLVVLFLWPDFLAAKLGKSSDYSSQITEEISKGTGRAALKVENKELCLNVIKHFDDNFFTDNCLIKRNLENMFSKLIELDKKLENPLFDEGLIIFLSYFKDEWIDEFLRKEKK